MELQQSSWPLIFLRPDGTRLEISAAAWQIMQHFIQRAGSATEAGGVLLGRHLCDGSAIIVDSVTTPMEGDRRSRTRFHRAQRGHQAAIDAAWTASDGTCTYLGEWHTHPEAVPAPSGMDLRDWQRRLRVDTYTEPLFFVIVGIEQIRAWEGRRSGLIVPLRPIQPTENS